MGKNRKIYRAYIKRLLDVFGSLVIIVFFWWLFVIIGFAVWLKFGDPILFRQARPGKNEKIFYLYKFRTMTEEKDETGKLLPDQDRLTKFGKWLRSTSLDELPELINILKGDMSFVGPRPLLVEYLPYYTEEESHRHDVLPGLSGWAQVNGRNVTIWDERLQQDIYYVNNCSFALDCKILWMTFFKVIKRSDILVGAQHGVGHGRLDVVRARKNASEE